MNTKLLINGKLVAGKGAAEKVLDPACGTGGFLTEAYLHLERQADTQRRRSFATNQLAGCYDSSPVLGANRR